MVKLIPFRCYRCGNSIEAPKKATVVCTRCGRIMWDEKDFSNKELVREEMLLCFQEQWE